MSQVESIDLDTLNTEISEANLGIDEFLNALGDEFSIGCSSLGEADLSTLVGLLNTPDGLKLAALLLGVDEDEVGSSISDLIQSIAYDETLDLIYSIENETDDLEITFSDSEDAK